MSQEVPAGEPSPSTTARSTNLGDVFGRTFFVGVGMAVFTGLVSGNVGIPLLGTFIGVIAGLAMGAPVALVVAVVITVAARPSVDVKTYRRCVDITLAIVLVSAIALTVVWINQHALVGPRSPIAMLVVVIVSLIVARFLLRRMKSLRTT